MFVARPRPLPPIDVQDLYWLAGLLEGEGSFVPGPPSSPRSPLLQISMADRDVIERAAKLIEAGITVVPARREGWRTAYATRLSGPRAVRWMERLRPLMGVRRQRQIDEAIASHAPNPALRLDNERATEALLRLAQGESVRQVAKRFGASVWCIYDLRLGRTHRHLPRPATQNGRQGTLVDSDSPAQST